MFDFEPKLNEDTFLILVVLSKYFYDLLFSLLINNVKNIFKRVVIWGDTSDNECQITEVTSCKLTKD
jgi:hypothetical protein